MRELAFAGIFLIIAGGLFQIESEVREDIYPYVVRGKWVALILAVMNVLRLPLKWSVRGLLRRIGWLPPLPEKDDAPPKPVVHPEFQISDDRIQNPPPPPGSIRP
jgi:hypothetical protein